MGIIIILLLFIIFIFFFLKTTDLFLRKKNHSIFIKYLFHRKTNLHFVSTFKVKEQKHQYICFLKHRFVVGQKNITGLMCAMPQK